MSAQAKFILSLVALAAVLVISTIGYRVLGADGNLTWLDAAYMTTITVSTVGLREVWPLDATGRVWTILVIIFGVGTVSVAFTSLTTLFVSDELRSQRRRKRMQDILDKLNDHVIICGFGRMGSLAASSLRGRQIPVAVVETDHGTESALRNQGVPYVFADATEEDALLRVGLNRARALVAVLPHDADNVYITLTARTLRQDLEIIARAEQPTTEPKLKRAGATRVICPQVIGATRITDILTRSDTTGSVGLASNGVDLEMGEHLVEGSSGLAGLSLAMAALPVRAGATVVAIKQASGETIYHPQADVELSLGDTLILVGRSGMSLRMGGLGDTERPIHPAVSGTVRDRGAKT